MKGSPKTPICPACIAGGGRQRAVPAKPDGGLKWVKRRDGGGHVLAARVQCSCGWTWWTVVKRAVQAAAKIRQAMKLPIPILKRGARWT